MFEGSNINQYLIVCIISILGMVNCTLSIMVVFYRHPTNGLFRVRIFVVIIYCSYVIANRQASTEHKCNK